ncbi:MAG TPA: Rid family hydrolase [Bryobacteraceae bacterium]|jgi:enamine deaminase RidA (YjgF/YER057c/UK114 family)|nr:Rid family hydrolase [Bryobacteraceae bacterium]
MQRVGLLALLCAVAVIVWPLEGKKKKKGQEEEPPTQTLQVLKDPPSAVIADTNRLVFHVSPLSAKGLLSQQMRDGLKALQRMNGGATIVKLRAFVAGSGDLRRVHDIVSETFADRRQPLPALTTVQVGALPIDGAQVVLESTSVAKKELDGFGLAFISGQGATSPGPLDPVRPLAQKALQNLKTAVQAAGSQPSDVMRVTCFLSSLDHIQEVRALFDTEYPAAAANYVQLQRAPRQAVAECEAVARLRWNTGSRLHLLNPDSLTRSPNFSQIALVSAPKVILTGTQVAFGFQDADARLAFERLQKALDQLGGSLKETAFSSLYPLSASIAEQVRKIRFDYYDRERPPASTMLLFEGLPSMDAGFAVDVVAVKN